MEESQQSLSLKNIRLVMKHVSSSTITLRAVGFVAKAIYFILSKLIANAAGLLVKTNNKEKVIEVEHIISANPLKYIESVLPPVCTMKISGNDSK